jgi:hypothetical protein
MIAFQEFPGGYRLIDGNQLNDGLAYPLWAYSDAITATSGGNVNNSYQISNTITNVTSAASGAGVVLPQALPGMIMLIFNQSSNPITVFAAAGSYIGAIAGNVGITQDVGFGSFYIGAAVGQWQCLPIAFSGSTSIVTKNQFISALPLMSPPADANLLYQAVNADWNVAATVQFNTSAYVSVGSPLYSLCQTTYGYTSGQMAMLMAIAASLSPWG